MATKDTDTKNTGTADTKATVNQPADETPFPTPLPTTVGSTGAGQPAGSIVNTPDQTTDVYANIPGATEHPSDALRAESATGTAPTEESVGESSKDSK